MKKFAAYLILGPFFLLALPFLIPLMIMRLIIHIMDWAVDEVWK